MANPFFIDMKENTALQTIIANGSILNEKGKLSHLNVSNAAKAYIVHNFVKGNQNLFEEIKSIEKIGQIMKQGVLLVEGDVTRYIVPSKAIKTYVANEIIGGNKSIVKEIIYAYDTYEDAYNLLYLADENGDTKQPNEAEKQYLQRYVDELKGKLFDLPVPEKNVAELELLSGQHIFSCLEQEDIQMHLLDNDIHDLIVHESVGYDVKCRLPLDPEQAFSTENHDYISAMVGLYMKRKAFCSHMKQHKTTFIQDYGLKNFENMDEVFDVIICMYDYAAMICTVNEQLLNMGMTDYDLETLRAGGSYENTFVPEEACSLLNKYRIIYPVYQKYVDKYELLTKNMDIEEHLDYVCNTDDMKKILRYRDCLKTFELHFWAQLQL